MIIERINLELDILPNEKVYSNHNSMWKKLVRLRSETLIDKCYTWLSEGSGYTTPLSKDFRLEIFFSAPSITMVIFLH